MIRKKFGVYSILLCFIFVITIFTACGNGKKDTSSVVNIKLNEVARSAFYAPMYVAINKGMFKEQGINIDLTTGQGADKTMQQVLSGSSDIGFCGPEQVIYIYNQKRKDFPVLFGQLTATDGSFLVGRSEQKDFKWESVKGKTIIGGRPGGVPEMALEYVLKKNNIQPGKDVNLITNLAYTATAGAFKANTGDYVALFEPTASMLEKDKNGYIQASIGESAGVLPYTCYFATKSYISKNPELIQRFINAIHKGQVWVQNHNDKEVAEAIESFFPGTDKSVLQSVVKNYRSIKAYADTPVIKEQDLNRLMDVIQSYKSSLIPERPPFDKIVDNSFAEKAVK
ncbi:ABC transporter substrate-binding protein [Clostridium luticellarii]|jgi:NitT/TauT family transport system substrate-binding protein|nr:ABC transporter substrate-binding protein [Clostridium luticellarii]MCI1944481.1 ABC transporter substrate-binding protein [Clostridium luticellarii]MCI1967980.1 ABC transporter substrate-binding protein [Clostridium luticellarii]MCI1995081.1 ABC transporter substrate-binding protein [Clostridium luticellarii]MCI2039240.1 ABC transporter substrate-binding protein [Clostridium luticellarii]